MAAIAVQTPGLTGAVITYTAAAAGGDTMANTGVEKLRVKNGGGASINVTINSQRPCDQGTDHDLVIAVAAGAEKEIGPFPPYRFGNPVQISYSAVTTVTVAATK